MGRHRKHKRGGHKQIPLTPGVPKLRAHSKWVYEKDVLHIFTDGSCYPNPGPGGWGVRLMWNGHRKDICGGSPKQTNNTMEFEAIRQGLLSRRKDVRTIIYTDSQYCINCLTQWWPSWRRKGWRTSTGSEVKNVEHIKAILALLSPLVSFVWVKGHAGIEHNEAVDVLAKKGREEYGTQ